MLNYPMQMSWIDPNHTASIFGEVTRLPVENHY